MIKHDGMKMPVSGDTLVRVRFHSGETNEGIANVFDWVWWGWDGEYNTNLYDIIAYEVIEEVKSEREVLVVYSIQDSATYPESEFLSMLSTEYDSIEYFFDTGAAFVIKDGKFRELTEDDVEINPKLKI